MKSEIKTNEVTELPCLMQNNYGQIVMVTYGNEAENEKYVTVVANKDKSYHDVGKTWLSDVRPDEYKPLPAGYQVTITN